MLLVVHVLAGILAAAGPPVLPDTMDDRLLPLAPEATAIAGSVDALAIDDIVGPLTLVDGAIDPIVAAEALLLAIAEATLVASTFDPSLHTMTILEVVLPLALVGGAAFVVVNTGAAGPVPLPLADEDVAITVREAAFPHSAILDPFALVRRSVRPRLAAKAVALVVLPLPDVGGTCLEGVFEACWQCRLRLQLCELLCLAVEVTGALFKLPVACGGLVLVVVTLVHILLVRHSRSSCDQHVATISIAAATLIR
mmetsp:Transcript_93572/g.302856  ORF Transcript_93572/g.302856 Transcript_93572/m.302856 type:complete len:254 (+) Transcript_93572:437-1198(+)